MDNQIPPEIMQQLQGMASQVASGLVGQVTAAGQAAAAQTSPSVKLKWHYQNFRATGSPSPQWIADCLNSVNAVQATVIPEYAIYKNNPPFYGDYHTGITCLHLIYATPEGHE